MTLLRSCVGSLTGPDGTLGADGTEGADGVEGADGMPGVDGSPGVDGIGIDGVDTPGMEGGDGGFGTFKPSWAVVIPEVLGIRPLAAEVADGFKLEYAEVALAGRLVGKPGAGKPGTAANWGSGWASGSGKGPAAVRAAQPMMLKRAYRCIA